MGKKKDKKKKDKKLKKSKKTKDLPKKNKGSKKDAEKKKDKKKDKEKGKKKSKKVKKKTLGKDKKVLVSEVQVVEVVENQPAVVVLDKSINYNVREAVVKIRAIETLEELSKFVRGDKRITVKKAVVIKKNRL